MITSSGPMCDVCGKYILPIDPNELVHTFSIAQFPGETFHCDNKCKEALIAAGSDWTKLPDGPIKQTYERINKAAEAKKN